MYKYAVKEIGNIADYYVSHTLAFCKTEQEAKILMKKIQHPEAMKDTHVSFLKADEMALSGKLIIEKLPFEDHALYGKAVCW